MSYHEYVCSLRMTRQNEPFYGLIMAAMRQADSGNLWMLKHSWPEVWEELEARYNTAGGKLESDD